MKLRRLAPGMAFSALALPLAAVAYANDAASASGHGLTALESQAIAEASPLPTAHEALADPLAAGPPAELPPPVDAEPLAELVPPISLEPLVEFDPNAIPEDIPLEEGRIVSLTEDPALVEPQGAPVPLNDLFYNPATHSTNWIIGNNDRFGMVSLESSMSLRSQDMDGIVGGADFHFLDGPIQTEMPPRLFDLVVGYGRRRWITSNIGYDVLGRVGIYTDFEGSARKGVRFPGHAVLQIRTTPDRDWLFGVEVLDRDDISLLPVIGPRWRVGDDWELELVFPRPRVAVRLPVENHWAYLRGELGGGTWAIEREESIDDNVTYRDLRIAGGYEFRHHDGATASTLEIAYVFARDLSYRTGIGMDLEDAVMISFASRY